MAERIIIRLPPELRGITEYCGANSSPAVRAGPMLYLSGMVAIDPATGEREFGSLESEARRALENVGLVLRAAGSGMDRIMQIHAIIHTRVEYENLNRVYAKFLPHAPPARTVWDMRIEHNFKAQFDVIALA
jgi:2-iminobutanoate/2-iminopropanoate deaminase